MKLPSLGKKNDAEQAPTGESPKKGKSAKHADKKKGLNAVSLTQLSRYMMLGALLILSLFAAAAFYFDHYQTGLLYDATVQRQAQQVADSLELRVKGIYARLDTVARDPRVIGAVSNGDDEARNGLAEDFVSAFPGIWVLRIIPADIVGVNEDLDPAIGYADLDMINRSLSTTKAVPAEAHGRHGKSASLVLVQPVMDLEAKQVVGHIMAYYHQKDLHAWLKGGADFPGKLDLVQSIGAGHDLTLLSVGNVGETSSETSTIAIPGTSWRLMATADLSRVPLQILTLMVLGAMLIGALVLSALLIFGLHGRYRKALRSDLAIIKRFLDGREAASSDGVSVQVEELRETIRTLWQADVDGSFEGAEGLATEATVDLDLDLELELADDEETSFQSTAPIELPFQIFRSDDIRGTIDDDFTPDVVTAIGRSLGSEVYEQGEQAIIVGRDGRHSSVELSQALIAGLRSSGRDVRDIGLVPTPVLYFATHFLNSKSGVMLSGGDNPLEYSGIKMVVNNEPPSSMAIQGLRERLRLGNMLSGMGDLEELDVIPDYISRVISDINVERPLRLVVDCGNGAASDVAPELLRELGCDVSEMFCEVDGDFPNHHPDPSQDENLEQLAQEVERQGADVGLAFGGDGDRLGVVASDGAIIRPDRLMMLFAEDILLRNPGAIIVYDVRSSAKLGQVILERGGRPLMAAAGHSLISARMKETGALLGGEFSGHIMFKERWFGFDDALYTAARLIELLSYDPRNSAEIFEAYPDALNTPELLADMPEGRNLVVMESLKTNADFGDARVVKLDGLRVEYPDGWGLVRVPNTHPGLGFRFEADDKAAMRHVQDALRAAVLQADPSIVLPF